MPFRWNDWNVDHVAKHGVTPEEAELVVARTRPPYPEKTGDGKWLVRGRGVGDRFVQITYVLDADGTIYVIHARPLTDREKVVLRRRQR